MAERWQAEKDRAIELLKRDLAELYGDGETDERGASGVVYPDKP